MRPGTAAPTAALGSAALQVLVVETHPIFRHGLAGALRALPDVGGVETLPGAAAALLRPELLAGADIVFLDCADPDALALVHACSAEPGAAVIVCSANDAVGLAGKAISSGASGFLARESITSETLRMTLEAVASGANIVSDNLLERLVAPVPSTAARRGSVLNQRELTVLSMIADGLPTREIAARLCYSERTVKNVVHDAVTKLGVRTRTQAVAHAVRAGMI